ncbi:FxsA family protein [Thalassotalea aquiviva]|uniref:FxsA family protein n=1 Tax=Thalassotalea aquiviva TaxID=3242415 RepID=UPI00352B5664
MFRILFLLFVFMPILEILVLINVGALIGAWQTIAIVIITAWLGAYRVKQQGMATYQSVQHKLHTGEMPSDEIIGALLLLVSGVLLITPGFITDIFGFLILWPVTRQMMINLVKKKLIVHSSVSQQGFSQSFHHQSFDSFEQGQPPSVDKVKDNTTIEGEFERKN